jgi:hypothetical protein
MGEVVFFVVAIAVGVLALACVAVAPTALPEV